MRLMWHILYIYSDINLDDAVISADGDDVHVVEPR